MKVAKVIARSVLGVSVAMVLVTLAPCQAAQEARASFTFEEGQQQLKQGDFEKALATFAQAAQLDPANRDYATEAAILRRVIKLRADLPNETDNGQWVARARALRAYYYDKGLQAEALGLDRQMHEKIGDTGSAIMLAESLIENGMDQDASRVLADVPGEELSTAGMLLLGLAETRQGQALNDRVRAAASGVSAQAPASEQLLLARLQSRLGQHGETLALLRAVFERTPGSQQPALRARVQDCDDFESFAGNADFAKVLQTGSKISESSCSAGTSCGACPSRTACGSGK